MPNHDGSNNEARAQNKHKKSQPQSQGLLLTFTVLYSEIVLTRVTEKESELSNAGSGFDQHLLS